MTDQELIEGLTHESEPFKNFFRMLLVGKVAHANAMCGYEDTEFVEALDRMFDDPESLRSLSVEHRTSVKFAYSQAKAGWAGVTKSYLPDASVVKH